MKNSLSKPAGNVGQRIKDNGQGVECQCDIG